MIDDTYDDNKPSTPQMTTDKVCDAIKHLVAQQGGKEGGPDAGLPVLTLRGFTGDEDPALRDLLAVNGKLVIEISAIPMVSDNGDLASDMAEIRQRCGVEVPG